jgi:hypothetical protein
MLSWILDPKQKEGEELGGRGEGELLDKWIGC